MSDWLRLAAATVVVLAPGWAIARALGRRGASAVLAWGLLAIAVALGITFAVHGSLWLTLALELAFGTIAVPFAGHTERLRGSVRVFLAGLAFGGAVWFLCGPIGGDGLFHLARVRKLDALGGLSLRAVDEFRDGGLHPGYAFPLWHGFLALVAKVASVDPAVAVRYEPALLVPIAFLVAYEAGAAVFGTPWGAVAVLLGQVALYGLAAGHGGSYVVLANPGTAVRQLLAPAGIALFFAAIAERGWRAHATLAALALCAALIHPAFAAFMLLPLAGYAVVRPLLARGELRETAAALAAAVVPVGLVLAWLRPLVDETASHNPTPAEQARAIALYRGELHVLAGGGYRLAADVLGRSGAVAVAALVAVPFAGLAARRRWAALVLGGSLVVLGLVLVPFLFTHLSDAVSLSQSRRAAGFLPFAFAFAGGAWALARIAGPLAPPVALAAGIALQIAWPGDFGGRTLAHSAPAIVAWIAAVGGAAALVVGVLVRPHVEERRGRLAAAAAALFVLPVAVHGFAHWSAPARVGATGLTPGLVQALRAQVPERAVVFSDLETSYRIAAYAPVYVAAAPPAHVADTRANHPYRRAADVRRWLRTGDLAIPRSYGAGWIVVARGRGPRLALPQVYADGRYTLYRLRS